MIFNFCCSCCFALNLYEANKHLCVQYIEPVFSLLFNLLKEVRECDTKVRLDQVPGGGAVPVLVSCPRYLFF